MTEPYAEFLHSQVMESKRISRKSMNSIEASRDTTAITLPSSEAPKRENTNTIILERESWNSKQNDKNYEKISLSLSLLSCFKRDIVRHTFYLSIIIFMISVFFIWTYTLHKVNILEDNMKHIESQILINIKSIKEHHNSTFKDLEEKHNELKDLVNLHSMIISSSSWTISKKLFDSHLLFAQVIFSRFSSIIILE